MKEFNEQVKIRFLPLLASFGFSIEEEFAGFLRFGTENVRITFSQDQRTNEKTLFLGYKYDGHEFEEFDFNYALQVLVPTNEIKLSLAEESAEDLMSYYQTILQTQPQILEGDREFLRKLRIHFQKSIDEYNFEMNRKQLVLQANDAWSRRQYAKFVELLEPFKDELSAVDSKRLQLAKKYSKS